MTEHLVMARAALRTDGRRIARDRFLVGTVSYLVVVSVAMRWVIPWVTRGVSSRWGFDLTPLHPLIVSHIVVQLAPLLVGVVGAFLLLESREERTIKAVLVSPLPLRSYVAWSSGVMVAASALLMVVEAPIIGTGLPGTGALLATAVVGSLFAPAIALGVAGAASNKTQAFAYLKVVGVAPLVVSGSYFLTEPLQWVAVVYPPYLAVKAYWIAAAGGGSWPSWLVGGTFASAAWGLLAARLFARSARM